MRYIISIGIICFCSCFLSARSHAEVLVDTGEVTDDGYSSSLHHSKNGSYQFHAYLIEIQDEVEVQAIAPWMEVCTGGNINVKILQNKLVPFMTGADVYENYPGEQLYAEKVSISGREYEWYKLGSFNWKLTPGKYWISLEPEMGVEATVMSGTQNPLAGYASKNDLSEDDQSIDNGWQVNDGTAAGDRLGLRVFTPGPEINADSIQILTITNLLLLNNRDKNPE